MSSATKKTARVRLLVPDAAQRNPNQAYLESLISQAGLTYHEAAARLGLSPRQMRYYLSTDATHIDAPYPVQFALESLAHAARSAARSKSAKRR